MSEPTPLWPKLGFLQLGALDYGVMQFDTDWLLKAAERLHDASAACQALGALRWSVGECLRRLAEAPAARKELNHYLERAPQSVRGLNIAVHYLASSELNGKSASAQLHVARAWSMKEPTVKDLNRKYGKRARPELEAAVKLVMSRPQHTWTRSQVLEAFDADMTSRAQLPWFNARRSKSRR